MAYEWIVFLGAFISILASIPYIKGMIKGNVKPNRVTWLMWSIAPLIATAAAISDGVGWPVVPVFISGFVPLLIFISSFKNHKAYWKLGRFDYICGFLSLIALVFWGITHEPAIAVIFAIASDFFAGIPTLSKLWSNPETENVYPYLAGLFNAFTGLAAISLWTFSSYAFPAYLAVINVALILFFYSRPIRRYLK